MTIKERYNQIRSEIKTYYETNKKRIQILGFLLLAIVASSIYWSNFYLPQQEKEAELKFAKIYHYFKTDSFDVVLKGDKANKIMSAIAIADKYSFTKKGKEASLVVALTYLKKKEYKKSLDYIDNFSASDAVLAPSLIAAKAACYSGLKEIEKAAELYEKAAKLGDNDYTCVYYFKAGIHYELLKDYKSALACYEVLDSKFSNTQEGQNAEKYIYRLKGLMGDLNK